MWPRNSWHAGFCLCFSTTLIVSNPSTSSSHRFVHGGTKFDRSTILTPEIMPMLRECLPLAAIHNPNSMSCIDETDRLYPHLTQFIVFDTAFHRSIPDMASTYAIPKEVRAKFGERGGCAECRCLHCYFPTLRRSQLACRC